jgi:tRNA (pseudouridine54-N1)-methyltransferase
MREFVLVAHRVPWDGDFSLNDLTGSGGRVDLVARAIGAAFLVSNGIRRDVRAHLVVTTDKSHPRHLRFEWDKLRYLNPDERNASSLIRNALLRCPESGELESSPGVFAAHRGLSEVLAQVPRPLVLLCEGAAEPDWGRLAKGAAFVLSDQLDLTEEELVEVESAGAHEAGLGTLSLHTDHCVALVNHHLDRADRPSVDGTESLK